MTTHDADELTPEQARARDAVRGLPVPGADPAFRARLKGDFVSGQIGRSRTFALARPWYGRPWVRWVLAPVGAVAAVLFFVGQMSGPRWRVAEVSGEGIVVVDNRPIPARHTEELEAALRPGANVRVPAGLALEIGRRGTMLLHITPGTEMTLPAVPQRWSRPRVKATVAEGEVFIATGRHFRGTHLGIETPVARVMVSGSLLAVIAHEGVTCVCVLEGHVQVGHRGLAMEKVDPGRRRFIYGDGRDYFDEILAPEHAFLAQLADQKRDWLERDGE